MANLYDTLDIAGTDPGRIFAILPGDVAITYGDLERQTARYANALVACGVAPGDRVAIQAEKCIEMLFVYLAGLRAGAVFLPLNPAYTPAETGRALRDAKPALLICDTPTRAELQARGEASVPRIETLEEAGADRCAILPPTAPTGLRTARAPMAIWPRSFTPREPPASPREPC